jgi:hypothetical protein
MEIDSTKRIGEETSIKTKLGIQGTLMTEISLKASKIETFPNTIRVKTEVLGHRIIVSIARDIFTDLCLDQNYTKTYNPHHNSNHNHSSPQDSFQNRYQHQNRPPFHIQNSQSPSNERQNPYLRQSGSSIQNGPPKNSLLGSLNTHPQQMPVHQMHQQHHHQYVRPNIPNPQYHPPSHQYKRNLPQNPPPVNRHDLPTLRPVDCPQMKKRHQKEYEKAQSDQPHPGNNNVFTKYINISDSD